MLGGKDMSEKKSSVTFKVSIRQIRQIFENDSLDMDSTTKYNSITNILNKYFTSEDIRDVFEGFLRLFIELHSYASKFSGRNDDSLAIQTLQVFDSFITQCDPFDQDVIAESMPDDYTIFLKALKIAGVFKVRYIPKVITVFWLDNSKHRETAIKLTKHVLKKDLVKGIEWMSLLDLRDSFDTSFKEIVCHLFLANQTALLEKFVGEKRYRRLNLIQYFDEIMELELKRFKGRTDLEEFVLSDIKRLEKVASKYMKLYDISANDATNILNYRSRNALTFHHHRWLNNEMTLTNFEEIALHAMKESHFIRRFYLDFLCGQNLQKNAIYFAFRLGMNAVDFPHRLAEYCANNAEDVEEAKKKAEAEMKLKLDIAAQSDQNCRLLNGTPVYMVIDSHGLRRVMKEIAEEHVIGIDTEWKPHYAYLKEQVALIQIASSRAVFLIDVVVLEKRIGNNEWLEFFKVLFCSENCRKIGFDFRNDLRVLRSTFPFLSLITAEVKHVVCMYKLLQQILLIQQANSLVFPDGYNMESLKLYDIAKFFLGIELDKSEQNSNWIERPMRAEKKIYAALDAFCLIGCFNVIAERLLPLDNELVLQQLQSAAIINFADTKMSKKMQDPETGEYVNVPNESKLKEDDAEFIECILKTTTDMEMNAPAGKKFKSVDDFHFAMDSMLFGLGKNLRKCGFETELIKDRNTLIKFCASHEDFIAISTGKGFKQLEMHLSSKRLFCVPINTNEPKLNSQLVSYIMREFDIIIHPNDMRSRCVKCNKRAFVRLSRFIIKAMFYITAIQKNMEWLEIDQDQLQVVLSELHNHAITKEFTCNSEEMDLQNDDEYTVTAHDGQLTCRSRLCSVDLMNRLLLANEFPVEIGDMLSIRKDILDDPNSQYYICAICGKIHFTFSKTTKEYANEAGDHSMIPTMQMNAEHGPPTNNGSSYTQRHEAIM